MEKFKDNVTFEEILNQSLKSIKIGATITGKVIEVNDKDEIFVDIGYKADGIIPKKEYSFNEESKPQEEFKVGDKIKAIILKLNDGQVNVLMSYKKAENLGIKGKLTDDNGDYYSCGNSSTFVKFTYVLIIFLLSILF